MSGLLWVPWVSLQLSLHPEFPSVLEAYSATGDRILTNSGLNWDYFHLTEIWRQASYWHWWLAHGGVITLSWSFPHRGWWLPQLQPLNLHPRQKGERARKGSTSSIQCFYQERKSLPKSPQQVSAQCPIDMSCVPCLSWLQGRMEKWAISLRLTLSPQAKLECRSKEEDAAPFPLQSF